MTRVFGRRAADEPVRISEVARYGAGGARAAADPARARAVRGPSNLLAILRDELLATIARHIEFDPEKLSVKLERAGSVSTLEIDVEVPSDKIGSESRRAGPARMSAA